MAGKGEIQEALTAWRQTLSFDADNPDAANNIAWVRATAADGTELGEIYRDIGLPVMEALTAFHHGAYAQAVEHLLPARFDLWKMGGSHAQRDVIDWTLAEAAVRAGQRDIALSLAHERLATAASLRVG